MAMEGYSLKDVCRRVGLPPRKVIHWAETKLIRPEIMQTSGTGVARLYSERNLREFVLARELGGVGLTVPRLKKFLRAINKVPRFLDEASGIEVLRQRDGTLRIVGVRWTGGKGWRRFKSARGREGVTWIRLDLDAVRKEIADG
jgi:DNA-binding transcriptional MerR regulator